MGENPYNEVTGAVSNESIKGIADALKKVNGNSEKIIVKILKLSIKLGLHK